MIQDLTLENIIIVLITLVVAITLHEAMHAYAGYILGDDTAKEEGRVSLNPIKHVDPFSTIILPIITLIIFRVPILAAKPVPFNPKRVKWGEFGAAVIAFAGPLTNLVLATFAAGLIKILGGSFGIDLIKGLTIFLMVNVGLFVFNMIPLPPLDGSRVLYAFAPESVQRLMSSLEQFGIFIVFALVLMVPVFGEILINLNNKVIEFLI